MYLADGGSIEGQICIRYGKCLWRSKNNCYTELQLLALGFAAYQILAGGEKGMEKAKKTILYTAIGIAIVFLAPTIINQISGWFSNSGDAGVFSA